MSYTKALYTIDQRQLDELYEELTSATQNFAGYPCNTHFDYSELFRFLSFSLNNIGDPFATSNYQINTHQFEREVIAFFANLLKAKDYFKGYVSHGGTEGNLFGIDLGLQRFPGAVLYYSSRAHYSIDKIAHLLKAPVEKIPVLANGEIDYQILREKLDKHKNKPVVISTNIGTTMTGAVDDIEQIQAILKDLSIEDYHLHGDAALSGLILPFVDRPQAFNFADGIHSISISGHKFIGSPLPCGIALTNQELPHAYQPEIAYVKITDSTISGSRNGMTPLILWYAIKRYGIVGLRSLVQDCMTHIDYALTTFKAAGIAAWKNENSITLVFPRPSEDLIKKWQLAPYQDIAHMMIIPHVDKNFVDKVLCDLLEEVK